MHIANAIAKGMNYPHTLIAASVKAVRMSIPSNVTRYVAML